MVVLYVVLAAVAAGLVGWWLGRRGRAASAPSEVASGHVDGRPDVPLDPERFRVERVDSDGRKLLQYRGGRGSIASRQYLGAMRRPEIVRCELWDRPTPHSEYVLRSEWERD